MTRKRKRPVSQPEVHVERSRPFWNNTTETWAKQLPSCTDKSLSKPKPTQKNQWFSVHHQQPCGKPNEMVPLVKVLQETVQPQDPREINRRKNKRAKTELPLKAHAIRIYPTPEQEATLKQWFGVARWTYNQCVQAYRDNKTWQLDPLRKICLRKNATEVQDKPWIFDVPEAIRDEALRDFNKAVMANRAKQRKARTLKRKREKQPFFKFRSRSDLSQQIKIRGRDWNHDKGFYSTIFRKDKLRTSGEQLPRVMEHTFQVVWKGLHRWYLVIPLSIQPKNKNQAPKLKDSVVAVDPGVRTFMTCFNADGEVWHWGKGDIGKIFRLCCALDNLESRRTAKKPEDKTQFQANHRTRYHLKIAARRLRCHIRNLVDDMHQKLAKWFCENFHVILLPKFETSHMVQRGRRRIGSKTARAMVTWSHFRFRQRLLSKVREHPWCKVILCDEFYTSKTCGQCGFVHTNLGKAKQYVCPKCCFSADRDVNGARNILLRYLTIHDCEAPSSDGFGSSPLGQ